MALDSAPAAMNAKYLTLAATGVTSLLVVGLALGRTSTITATPLNPATPAARVATTRSSGIDRLLSLARAIDQPRGNRAWQLEVNRLTAAELPELFTRLEELPPDARRCGLRGTVITAWAECDPAAAAAAVATLAGGEERAGTAGLVFLEWLQVAPGDALAWSKAQSDFSLANWQIELRLETTTGPAAAALLTALEKTTANPLASVLRKAAFTRLAELDPASATTYAERQPAGPARDALLTQALTALAKQNPTAALTRAANLTGAQRQAVVAAATAATAARDPLDALALLEQLPAGPARLEAATSIVAGLAREDPDTALEFALTFPAGRMRQSLLSGVARTLIAADAPAALRWLQALPPDATRATLVNNFSWQLVQAESISPSTAADFALSLPSGYPRTSAVATAVGRMATQDLAATAAWLQTITDPEVRPAALRSLAEAWPQGDTTGAFTYAQRLPNETDREEFLSKLGQSVAERTTDATNFLAQLPAGPARDAFAKGIVENRWNDAPAEATLAIEAMSPGENRNSAATEVARNWARSDPTAAARWVENRSDLASNGATCAAVVASWAQWDPDGAAAWLARLPAGNGRSGAAAELVDDLKFTAPATAARWVGEIADADQRHRTIARLATPWLAADRATAAAWLARTDLPRESQQALLEGRPVPGAEEEEVVILSPFEVSSSY